MCTDVIVELWLTVPMCPFMVQKVFLSFCLSILFLFLYKMSKFWCLRNSTFLAKSTNKWTAHAYFANLWPLAVITFWIRAFDWFTKYTNVNFRWYYPLISPVSKRTSKHDPSLCHWYPGSCSCPSDCIFNNVCCS